MINNKNRQKAINWAPISLGEGVTTHLGHQACRLPLRDVASRVRGARSRRSDSGER